MSQQSLMVTIWSKNLLHINTPKQYTILNVATSFSKMVGWSIRLSFHQPLLVNHFELHAVFASLPLLSRSIVLSLFLLSQYASHREIQNPKILCLRCFQHLTRLFFIFLSVPHPSFCSSTFFLFFIFLSVPLSRFLERERVWRRTEEAINNCH